MLLQALVIFSNKLAEALDLLVTAALRVSLLDKVFQRALIADPAVRCDLIWRYVVSEELHKLGSVDVEQAHRAALRR